MNVEGDFRYVDPGAFDECADFVEYWEDCKGNWDDAFLNWIYVSEMWKEERVSGNNTWSPWGLMKVPNCRNTISVIVSFESH